MLLRMPAEAVLEVWLTDPHGPLDFTVMCQRNGYRLHAIDQLAEPGADGNTTVWRIRLGRMPRPPPGYVA